MCMSLLANQALAWPYGQGQVKAKSIYIYTRSYCRKGSAALRPLSCIITGGPAPILRSVIEVKPKTWRIFRQNDAISMTTLTLTRLNSEPTAVFTPPPWFLQKSFADNIFLVILNRFLKFFPRYKFSTFDYLDKDMQVVRVILARERRQTNLKPQEMWEKTRIYKG